jgi:hypothetical protein
MQPMDWNAWKRLTSFLLATFFLQNPRRFSRNHRVR